MSPVPEAKNPSDLSLDARIKYCSESIEDILGYKPAEVKGKSCWEYFHPDEIPFARAIHGRGLDLEKAAALNYCRIRHKSGKWIGCECVFTVVYDVLVASTAIYKVGEKAQSKWLPHKSGQSQLTLIVGRAVDGAAVRRVFSSSPRDPRYHMLSFISNKFTQKALPHAREPRAALILNRFTRTSTIMFATNGVEQILGFSPQQLVGKSFYYCIAENCLGDGVRTLESAKRNDSIAYLRFFFRDPTLPDPPLIEIDGSDTDESEDGGVLLSRQSSISMTSSSALHNAETIPRIEVDSLDLDGTAGPREEYSQSPHQSVEVDGIPSRTPSGHSTDMEVNGIDHVFDRPIRPTRSSASSVTPQETPSTPDIIEVEAVVSCTSDGLVVVLRRAHSIVPETATPYEEQPKYPNGLFASPWATDPVIPPGMQQATSVPSLQYPSATEPVEASLMSAIRDVAVFAWSLTGINGSLVDLAIGNPTGEAIPPGGLPVWDPNAPPGQNDNYNGFSGGTHRPLPGAGEPVEIDGEITSSDDEVVWRRVPQMPAFKRPRRRAHREAFGSDEDDSNDSGGAEVQDRRRRKLENGHRENST